ncbi:MAG: NRDE family protein [Pseudomonadota bacterium]
MCLLLLAIRSHLVYKLVLAANRDEYYERPTAPADFWEESPWLLAGRDLRAGGTWLGITTNGRIAAVTNYRDPASVRDNAPSRGELVSKFLLESGSPSEYLKKLEQEGPDYNGFNLVFGDKDRLYWYSNRGDEGRLLGPGIHGLSNHLLDTSWPKVTRGKTGMTTLLSGGQNPDPEQLLGLLFDRHIAEDERLPHTGVGLQWERILSPLFITSPHYGTRSSTLMLIDQDDRVTFVERTFDLNPDYPKTVEYRFKIEE